MPLDLGWYQICGLEWGEGVQIPPEVCDLNRLIQKPDFTDNYAVENEFQVLGFETSCVKRSDYRNVPKFSDRQVWANNVDPDWTAPRGAFWSGSTLFAILSTSFWANSSVVKRFCSNFRIFTAIFRVSKFLGFLRYLGLGWSDITLG